MERPPEEEPEDPAADTARFRAFAEQSPPEAARPGSGSTGIVLAVLAVVAVIVVVLLVLR
jgi:hypothetical protein